MSKLGVYFKELVPKTSIDTANSVNFVIYDPVKDIDLRVGLTQIQNYLQDNLLFREGDKQVHDITDVVKTGDNFTSIGTTVNSYKPDDVYIVTPSVANTGASNFSINAFLSLPLLKMSDNTVTYLEPGDFKNTSVILYRTTHFLLFSSNGNEEKVLETVTAGELLNIGNIITHLMMVNGTKQIALQKLKQKDLYVMLPSLYKQMKRGVLFVLVLLILLVSTLLYLEVNTM